MFTRFVSADAGLAIAIYGGASADENQLRLSEIEKPGIDCRCDQPQDCRHLFGNAAVNLKRLTMALNQFDCFDLP